MFAYTSADSSAGAILLVVMSIVTFVLFYASSDHPERFACGSEVHTGAARADPKALGYDEPSTCSGASSPRASSGP